MPSIPSLDRTVSAAVDARGLYDTGIGRYLREIIAGMIADARFRQISLLGDPEELHTFAAESGAGGRVQMRAYAGSWYSRRTQTSWLSLRASGDVHADVWFFPFCDAPLVAHPRRSVVTVHDLIGFKVPEASGLKYRIATGALFYAAVARARRVIAVSDSTRRDILERLPGVEGKIEVIPQGVNPMFHPVEPLVLDQHSRFAGLRPFLFCVGNRYPHKNWRAAVDALALLRRERGDLRLVMAGGRRGPYWEATVRHAEAIGIADALVDVGRVTDEELRLLYGSCEAFIFPSLYEGFGLPVLEAMACGAPVVASNRSSLPEVVGDAGFLVPPDDVEGMSAAVRELRRNPERRAALVRRGIQRAAQFTWEHTARRTADVLYRVANT